ncbi:MAG: phytanoyl-CoA dioxygenase family protein [Candidatus Binatus sp.]|uniref:phytanoyl-CoA dioxygenase family protein n=1 Tax=Candidatus Binatus sp. TaxID=2811406 RepID=UPI0027259913|nr:phytanoyl-CoA dioxygenase family protein [Candidatus Binatus sp.]MDO8431726.1 phytanoyl-CoA dioxygenase family protein [Candidatus Binatus sp.]
MGESLRLDAREKRELDEIGFVLRRSVFDAAEVVAIRADCEALVARLEAEQRHAKLTAGSYTFEIQRKLGTIVKWEPDALELVQGVEPFAHLSSALRDWALDPRLVEPSKDVVGDEQIAMFTEKLNLKRAHKGGPIVLHQDFPYWSDVAKVASRVATAMIFLDDANRENGCLEAVPGSHREGLQKRRSVEGFGSLELDPEAYDTSRLVALEVPAGSVVFFGPFLVHRSAPNRTDKDRRALLYSYQPAGHPHLGELIKLLPPTERL